MTEPPAVPDVRVIDEPSAIPEELRALAARWVVGLPMGVAVDVAAMFAALEAAELSDGRHVQLGPQARTAIMLYAAKVRRAFVVER